MNETVNLWPLTGIVVIVIGFLCRVNPVLVVVSAGGVSGLMAGIPVSAILSSVGKGFLDTRNLALILVLPLAVIGLVERHGLRQRARSWIARIHSATPGRLLTLYLFMREITAAMGLTSLGGHPQMVRPLLAPMTEGAAENRHGSVPEKTRMKLRALAAATDNIGLFFGEDIFVAFGGVLFMHNFMEQTSGIQTEPLHIALWGIPTALCAFVIHAFRLRRLDARLLRELGKLNSTALSEKGAK
ncbi:DUF969 domain-containing protein [Serratia marcescens]|nr:DUF969 domain-containing protein [Serratia marcescens]MBH2865964.1 DUF969 domain-containing protein [Serratia marcescens]